MISGSVRLVRSPDSFTWPRSIRACTAASVEPFAGSDELRGGSGLVRTRRHDHGPNRSRHYLSARAAPIPTRGISTSSSPTGERCTCDPSAPTTTPGSSPCMSACQANPCTSASSPRSRRPTAASSSTSPTSTTRPAVGARGRARRRARGGRPLRPRAGHDRGRGRVHGPGRPAGSRPRHDPARAPRRGRPHARHHELRGRDAPAQPPDARRLPRRRVRGRRDVRRRRRHVHFGSSRRRSRSAMQGAREHVSEAALGRAAARAALDRGRSAPAARPGTIGHEVFRNLLAGGFTGPVYPVNPRPRRSRACAPTPASSTSPTRSTSPSSSVPAAECSTSSRECATKRVRGLVVISAGFAEVGARRRARRSTSSSSSPAARDAAGRARTAWAWSTPPRRCR